eukprot:15431587-Alexandrium_andersonii.AAC.1
MTPLRQASNATKGSVASCPLGNRLRRRRGPPPERVRAWKPTKGLSMCTTWSVHLSSGLARRSETSARALEKGH